MTDEPSMEIQADRVKRLACGKCGKVLDVSELAPFSAIHCPHCKTPQRVPAALGAFMLTEQMGAGGMGAVYRAVDQALGRYVAIKVMKKQLGDDHLLVESFLREARAAAALNHPNIVQIYSCGQEKGQPYIVMELVGGGRLDQQMEGGKKVDEVRLLEIALDVAEGLKAANTANLVHGDIKPANILFDQRGTAKVVDFGLAQFVNRQQEQGGVWGTPYYISPERARGGKADHRSDIYSLGATMFHALAGQPPFEGKTATDVVVARLKGPPPKIRELEPSLQPETSALIERMMAADPVLRYPTSASLLADMREALQAAREARSAGGRAKKKKPTANRAGLWVAVAITGMVLGTLGALLIAHTRSNKEPSPSAGPAQPPPGEAETNQVVQAEVTPPPPTNGLTFSLEIERDLAQAFLSLSNQAPMEVYRSLVQVAQKGPRTEMAFLMWMGLLQAVPQWLSGETSAADELVRKFADRKQPEEPGNPEQMPWTLANLALGRLDEFQFADTCASNQWAAWFVDWGACLRGFSLLKDGQLTEAAPLLARYAGATPTDPAWVYALQPEARLWTERMESWHKEQQRLLELAQAGDLKKTRQELDTAAAGAPALARSVWEPVRESIRKTEARLAAEQERKKKEEEEAKRQALVQSELDLIKGFMATNTQFTGAAKEYRRLQVPLTQLQNTLQTPEGKEQATLVREQLTRAEDLKGLIIREATGRPFREMIRELGGEVSSATSQGIRITMSRPGVARSTIERSWAEVNPSLMLRLCRYYIDRPGRPDTEVADLYLSLAVYCVFNGGPAPAAALVKQAIERDPTSAEKAKRLLPEITPAE